MCDCDNRDYSELTKDERLTADSNEFVRRLMKLGTHNETYTVFTAQFNKYKVLVERLNDTQYKFLWTEFDAALINLMIPAHSMWATLHLGVRLVAPSSAVLMVLQAAIDARAIAEATAKAKAEAEAAHQAALECAALEAANVNMTLVPRNWEGPTKVVLQSIGAGVRGFSPYATYMCEKTQHVRTVCLTDFMRTHTPSASD
jgi:hypothetical protein